MCWVTGFRGYGLGLVVGLDFLASLWGLCGFCGLLVLLCIVALGSWVLCFAGWVAVDFGFAGFSLGWCLGVCGGCWFGWCLRLLVLTDFEFCWLSLMCCYVFDLWVRVAGSCGWGFGLVAC